MKWDFYLYPNFVLFFCSFRNYVWCIYNYEFIEIYFEFIINSNFGQSEFLSGTSKVPPHLYFFGFSKLARAQCFNWFVFRIIVLKKVCNGGGRSAIYKFNFSCLVYNGKAQLFEEFDFGRESIRDRSPIEWMRKNIQFSIWVHFSIPMIFVGESMINYDSSLCLWFY